MMRKTATFFILCLSVLMILGVAVCHSRSENLLSSLVFSTKEGVKFFGEINKSGDTLEVFLPSYTTIDMLNVDGNFDEVKVNDRHIDDSLLRSLSYNQPYGISVFAGMKHKQGEIIFHKSDNIASLFLDTETKSLNRLLSDKRIKERVRGSLFSSNGDCCYLSVRDTIKGRGNTSWNCPKKSWSFTLSDSTGLLGMSPQRHWALLANFYDQTHLRNKLAYFFASSVFSSWTPQCDFVDLYINGRYQGLYLLTQKIEQDNFGQQSWNKGQCLSLCSCEAPDRTDDMGSYFYSCMNVPIEVALPEYPTDYDLHFIKNSVNGFESCLKTKSFENVVDLSSWVDKYLFEEILANTDGGKISSYFTITKDGKLVAGPCWDYDASWGINLWGRDPFVFYVRTPIFSKDYTNPWFNLLCDSNEFWSSAQQQYLSSFRSNYIRLVEQELPYQDSIVRSARMMDSCRWRKDLEDLNKYLGGNQDVASMQSFMQKRLQFFDDIFIFDKHYKTVTVIDSTSASPCFKYSVQVGRDESIQDEVVYSTSSPRQTMYYSRIIVLFWVVLAAILVFLAYFFIHRNV